MKCILADSMNFLNSLEICCVVFNVKKCFYHCIFSKNIIYCVNIFLEYYIIETTISENLHIIFILVVVSD